MLSECDHTPFTQSLPLCMCSGDQNVPPSKASADQNVPQHQKATFEGAQRFMKAIVFTKTSWPILSNDKYSIVEDALILAIEAQDCQQALAGDPVGTSSVCQLPGGPSLKIHLQIQEARSLEFCFLLLYPISDIDYTSKYPQLKLKISPIWECLADRSRRTFVRRYQLDLYSETQLQIQVKELLFEDAYLSKVVDNNKSWSTQMEVLHLIYHQSFFTANSMGWEPMISQYVHHLSSQRLALGAAAMHCVLSEYGCGNKATVMFSQDGYQVHFAHPLRWISVWKPLHSSITH